jgi:uncharacterized membrane protein (UPF0182 family)
MKSLKKSNANIDNGRIFLGYGAIYILTKNFFLKNKKLNYPDDLFLMQEEIFLSYQIQETNGIIYFDKSLLVHHRDHSSCRKIPKKLSYIIQKKSYKACKEKLLQLNHVQPQ